MNTESSNAAPAVSAHHKKIITGMLRTEGICYPMIRIEWRKRLGPVAYAAVEQGFIEQPGGPVSDLTDERGVYWETVKLRGVWTGWNEYVVTDADRMVFELRDIVPCYLLPEWHAKLAELVGYGNPAKPAVELPPEPSVRQSPTRPLRKARHAISVKQAMADFGVSKSTIEAWQRGEKNPPKLFDLDEEIQYAVCLKQYSENTEFRTNVTKGLTTETGRHKGRQTPMSRRIDTPDPRSLHRRPGDDDD